MTVAAVVLVPDAAVALGDADGEPAVRRVAHAAWAGGALPIVLVSNIAAGQLEEGVAGLPVTLARPGPDQPRGIAWFVHGQQAARAAVAETTAGLLWPLTRVWVDPETVTSLVEAHGATPDQIVRPAWAGQVGFPILVPATFTERLAERPDLPGDRAIEAIVAAGAPYRLLELGDPGIVYDLITPRSDLPAYQGPAAGVPSARKAEPAADGEQGT